MAKRPKFWVFMEIQLPRDQGLLGPISAVFSTIFQKKLLLLFFFFMFLETFWHAFLTVNLMERRTKQ